MLKRALEAIGYTDGSPLFRARHPVFNTATSHEARSAVFVQKTTKTPGSSCSRIVKWENPLFRDFFEAPCQYNLIPTFVAPCKMTSCYFQAISGVFLRLSGARHSSYGEVLHLIAAADAGMRLCLGSTTSLLVQPPNRSGGLALRQRSPQIPAPLVRLQLPGLPQWPHWWALRF